MPRCFGASGSVRASRIMYCAKCARLVQILLPLIDEAVAIEHGAGLQRREVGARAGLAEALAPDRLAANDRRQELLLLILGAVEEDRRTDAVAAEVVRRRFGRGHLLVEHELLHVPGAAAAPLLRPGEREPALRRELADELAREAPGIDTVGALLGQLAAEECAHLVAKRLVFGCEAKVHYPAPSRSASRSSSRSRVQTTPSSISASISVST